MAGDRAEEGSVLLPPLPPPGAVLCERILWEEEQETACCTPSGTVSLSWGNVTVSLSNAPNYREKFVHLRLNFCNNTTRLTK